MKESDGVLVMPSEFPNASIKVCGLLIGRTPINPDFKGHAFPFWGNFWFGVPSGWGQHYASPLSRCPHQA